MVKDPFSFRPEYFRLMEEFERMSRTLKPSHLKMIEDMNRALEPIRERHSEMAVALKQIGRTIEPIARQHSTIARAIEPIARQQSTISKALGQTARASTQMQSLLKSNQHTFGLISQVQSASRVLQNFQMAHKTWTDKIEPMRNNLAFQAVAGLSLSDVAHKLTVAEQIFSRIDFGALDRAILNAEPVMLALESRITESMIAYEHLSSSIGTLPDLTHLPEFTLPGATREIFTTGYALDTVFIDEEYDEQDLEELELIDEFKQETSDCVILLQGVDPALVQPYLGAREAFESGNVDHARHMLTSLRELWNHLLRRLAPDEKVLPWVPEQNEEFIHQGRPTRKARILYICRDINHDPLSDFLVKDTAALVELVRFLNRMHELQIKLEEKHLRALLLRTDSWLMYILQIWEGAG